jgi:hypothetical protein
MYARRFVAFASSSKVKPGIVQKKGSARAREKVPEKKSAREKALAKSSCSGSLSSFFLRDDGQPL